ncbi:MAG: site-specific integrase [Planctomycetaceae bacterium]|nr:site-specific integrase [Planctomycetaceae bacterium]
MGVIVRQKIRGPKMPWSIFICQNGKIRQKTIGDKKLADAMAIRLRRKLIQGELHLDNQNKSPEFSSYADSYIQSYAKTTTKQNTWKGYESIIRLHLNPVWRGKRLDEIKRSDVKQLLLQKQQNGVAPKTAKNIKALISGLFTHAVESEIILANPALRMGKFIEKTDCKKVMKFLTKEQVSTFLIAAQKEAPEYYPLLLCAFRTGMRLGELLGLAFEDIDFNANQITVRRSYTHGHFTSPKSHKTRYIDMSNQLHQTLYAHYSSLVQKFSGSLPRYELSEKFKPDNVIRLVFPNRTGEPLDGDNFRNRIFYKILDKADVPRIRFHDIRHTFASLLLQQGESLHYVKEQMGHASIQTTVDVYGHIVPGSNRQAVNKLDEAVPVIGISKAI